MPSNFAIICSRRSSISSSNFKGGAEVIRRDRGMPAYKLEEVHDAFAQALNAGDVDALISLYEPEAVVAPQPSQVLAGREAIREAMAEYLAKNPKFTLHSRSVIQAGEIALLRSRWTISETDASGKTVEYEVNPTLVMRLQGDGTWRVVIDNPSGGE